MCSARNRLLSLFTLASTTSRRVTATKRASTISWHGSRRRCAVHSQRHWRTQERRICMSRSLVLALGGTLCLTMAAPAAETVEELFARRVQPLLKEKCQACHGD